jgi:hypothetical protein
MMIMLFSILLLLGMALACGLGLLCMLRDLVERNADDGPSLRDPFFENPEIRSQFSWKSRTHSRTHFRPRD